MQGKSVLTVGQGPGYRTRLLPRLLNSLLQVSALRALLGGRQIWSRPRDWRDREIDMVEWTRHESFNQLHA